MLGRAATCLFLDVVTAPHSTVTVSLVFLCNFGVRSMWPRSGPFNPSPKKDRERDKAQHMPLCVPHVVQARVDELTEMSDLGPTR